ncbi:MAG: hypothetical protein U0984_05145, partial [Prosthecobacter sp.]|nr:hypothetical protein [Prosthecobacter sp.]
MPATPSTQRLFWGWDAPVLEKATAFLLRDWQPGTGALDLSDTLIIVPTAEAGRRLKEALARETAVHDLGASIPWVWSPEQALLPRQLCPGMKSASRLQSHLAWQRALRSVALESLQALFPALPEERGWSWQAEMARLMAELNALLGAGGRTFAELPALLSHDSARWRDLAVIERAYLAELSPAGLEDTQALKRAGASAPILPEGLRRVVIFAAPDLPPLFDRWVQSCTDRGLEVTVAVHAPPQLAHTIDAIGRPLPAHWGEDADQTLPLTNDAIHLGHDAARQAATVITLLRHLAQRGHVALGVSDPEVGA